MIRRERGYYSPQAGHSTLPVEPHAPGFRVSTSNPSSSDIRKKRIHTLSQSLWTSCSASCLQSIKLSTHPSRVGIDNGSNVVVDNWCGSGILPTSSIFVSMLFIISVRAFHSQRLCIKMRSLEKDKAEYDVRPIDSCPATAGEVKRKRRLLQMSVTGVREIRWMVPKR